MKDESQYNLNKNEITMIMVGLMAGLLVAAIDSSIISTAMPKIIGNLQGMEYYAWPFTAYMLTSTIATILFSKLSGIYGRKSILMLGIIIFVIASVLCGFATNMLQLILFRGLQGIGGGILLSLPFIIMGEVSAPRERAKYLGILGSIFGISGVLGPILGGVITDAVSWRWVFFVNVPVGIAAIAIIMHSLPNFKLDNIKNVFDYSGIVTFVLAISSFFIGLTLAKNINTSPLAEIIGLFIFAALMFVLFILFEKRADEPILPMHLFNNYTFTISGLENFLGYAVTFGGIVYVPLFAQNVMGMSATNAGMMMIPMLLSLTISANIAGQIISKTEKYKKLAISEFLITGLGLILMSTMNVNTSPYALVAYSTIFGLGAGILYTTFMVSVQNAVSNKELGIATASMQFFRNVGATVTIPIFGYIINSTITSLSAANLSQKEVLAISINNVFLISLIITFICLILSFFLKEMSFDKNERTIKITEKLDE